MGDDSDPRRDALHTHLQHAGPPDPDIQGALLTGWVIVCEWASPDGSRWLSRGWAPTTTAWTATGMMHEAIYGDWPAPDDD